MANYPFNGTESQTVAFDPAQDRVILNLNAADIASISEDARGNSISIISTSGAVLTLTGVTFAALTTSNIIAGLQSDIVLDYGTAGDDAGLNSLEGNVVLGLAGNDELAASADGSVLFGNQGNDELDNAGFSNVRLYGGQDADTLTLDFAAAADSANDSSLLVGGLGLDEITVGTAFAYSGDVTVYGGNESNDPTDGADTITAALSNTGTALIYGNGGSDEITVTGLGSATIFGGQGDDTVAFTGNSASIVGGLGEDEITVTTAGDDAAVTVYGGNGNNDRLDGADVINVGLTADGDSAVIYGNAGEDVITVTGLGNATVFGGADDDQITFTGNSASIVGGLGGDTLTVTTAGSDATVTVVGGNGTTDAADGDDIISVTLTTADDTAVVYGNGGDDEITIDGLGLATVFGGQGNDTLIINSSLNHVLTGGAGDDTFDFSGAADTTAADEIVSITDFTFGEDTIVFDAAAAVTSVVQTTLATGDFAAITGAASATAGAVTLVTVSSGDLAGTYAVYDDQVVEVTGFTGTISADSFSVA
ncbi:calcium-binding protein [Aureimonas sp. ME7]|uniref:beta strand repeat-containing protein n=1 Tax=Aureimonas sp. ME7 TaxID=2744252 RepID=UPI0015F60F39|nr:calcium-binding protein [Aureimonas sp. ME7]